MKMSSALASRPAVRYVNSNGRTPKDECSSTGVWFRTAGASTSAGEVPAASRACEASAVTAAPRECVPGGWRDAWRSLALLMGDRL